MMMTDTPPEPEIFPLGVDGVLVRFATSLSEVANERAISFCDHVTAADLAGVTEVASSLVSVRIGFDPAKTSRSLITKAVKKLLKSPQASVKSANRLWHIPTAFGPAYAPQLAEVSSLAGMTESQAVAQIVATKLRVIAIGFAPGQPYLGMLPPQWDVPRQTELTDGLPRGALITAVRQLIIWAADAPTGWRHVGQTAFEVYRPDDPNPFALQPGDEIRFAAVSDTEFQSIKADQATNGGAKLTVLR